MKSLLRPEGKFLVAEPAIHVTRVRFERTLKIAGEAGFTVEETPKISMSHTAVLS
jgi:hypothetical protein